MTRIREHARRAIRAALALAAAGATTIALGAHPAATTTVSIATTPARVLVTFTADADPLIVKLDALAPVGASHQDAPGAAKDARIRAGAPVLLSHIGLESGGTNLTPTLQDVVVGDDGRATIHLAAAMPVDARDIRWRTTLVFGSYPLAVHREGRDDDVEWLAGDEWSRPVPLAMNTSRLHTIAMALGLGFTHILPNGLDHILFVLGLFFLSTRARQVLLQVSAFTLAHSITLGLTLYGLISLPSRVVEPLIALSVTYVGIENLVTSELKPWRVLIVFGFGLLHGMGFADALANLHLAREQFLTTLVGFNVGVEAGQLTVIAVAAVVMAIALHARETWRRPAARLASAAIGVIGLLWTIQRVI